MKWMLVLPVMLLSLNCFAIESQEKVKNATTPNKEPSEVQQYIMYASSSNCSYRPYCRSEHCQRERDGLCCCDH